LAFLDAPPIRHRWDELENASNTRNGDVWAVDCDHAICKSQADAGRTEDGAPNLNAPCVFPPLVRDQDTIVGPVVPPHPEHGSAHEQNEREPASQDQKAANHA
jgi:hypothetical protein